jgi:hypothetical protein
MGDRCNQERVKGGSKERWRRDVTGGVSEELVQFRRSSL